MEPALWPVCVQFCNNPVYAEDWSETISDVCLVFFRLGVGGFAEAKLPDNQAEAAPATRVYTLTGYSDYVGELGGFLLTVVAFSIWLPLTLLGLCLASNSETHQSNWKDWQANGRINELRTTLRTNNFEPMLLKIVVDNESEEVFAWMATFIYKNGSSKAYEELQKVLIASPVGAARIASKKISDNIFKDLIRVYIENGMSVQLHAVALQSEAPRKAMIRQLLELNDNTLSESNQLLLRNWNSLLAIS